MASGAAGPGPTVRAVTAEPVPDLDPLLGPEGWAHASSPPVGAGDPGRYHALFGRDSLLTALAVLPARPDVARATLRALAARQGRELDPDTEEAPGRVLHEHWDQAPARLRAAGWPVRDDGVMTYFGSADSTSWFLHLLATTGDRVLAAELEPAWRAAGAWLLGALERGRGFVRWGPRERPGGLEQQGWRDTLDATTAADEGGGIVRADGSLPAPPVADADTQAAAVAGLRALAALSGDPAHARALDALVARVTAAFGTGETLALEGDDTPVPGAGSHLGWLLWARSLEPAAVPAVAERLCAPDVLTPHGLRTLSADHPRFAPGAYHRGSIWPFDSWLGWGGLRAAGRAAAAERVRAGVLAALDALGPVELYAVGADGAPAPLPAANRVQAWTVGARWALAHGWDGR